MPRLRQDATKKTFEALIGEWHEAHADQWGWYGRTHHRMLALRSARKAAQLTGWLHAFAPGYLTTEAVRSSSSTSPEA